ncbi:MAG: ISAzo13 family transposase [Verrucomicrobiota bacterium]
MLDATLVGRRFKELAPYFDERLRRLWAAAEAGAIGHGGAVAVERSTGVSRRAIAVGRRELEVGPANAVVSGRIRSPGGGRKKSTAKNPDLIAKLLALVEPGTRGDPEQPLRWTCKSVRNLAAELRKQGISVSHQLVSELLQGEGYSLQANAKIREGGSHPDRNAQFEYINERIGKVQAEAQPVISVDTKKKELVGDFKNSGREWRPKGQPEPVRVYDFIIPEMGRANPYGIFDLAHNKGWMSVGTDHDTAAFAVSTIRRWWMGMGTGLYPAAKHLLITADGGGSNGSRNRLWKRELQTLANETGLVIEVAHLPPGTSKWNKIEHRLFSFISQNWRGKPLTSHEVIVQLIAATTNRKGLTVHAEIDSGTYPPGTKVTVKEMAQLCLEPAAFHGEWNYTIRPQVPSLNATLIS